ncbi:hypothetical protein U1Q18_022429, partial [Sarracenia purpurea var. burkii]
CGQEKSREDAWFSLCHTFGGPFSGNFTIVVSQLSVASGSLRYTATEEEIETMISVVDADGNRCISLDEFVGLNTKDIYSDDVLENLKEALSSSTSTRTARSPPRRCRTCSGASATSVRSPSARR